MKKLILSYFRVFSVLGSVFLVSAGVASAQKQPLSGLEKLRQYEERTFTRNSPEMTGLRSKFGKQAESGVQEFTEKFHSALFLQRAKPPIRVEPGSLAAKESQLAFLLMDVLYVNSSMGEFITSYFQDRGSHASLDFRMDFAWARKRVTMRFLRKFQNLVSRENPTLGSTLGPLIDDLESFMNDYCSEMERYATESLENLPIQENSERFQKSFEISRDIETKVTGVVGELYMGVSLPGAFAYGRKVRQIPDFLTFIEQGWKPLEARLQVDPELFQQYSREYPGLFVASVRHIEDQPVDEKLKVITNRIMNEDVDVIRKVGGVYFWGESKMSFTALDFESLSGQVGFNTMGDQIRSKEEISKLLRSFGMNVHLEIMSGGGFEKTFATELRGRGWSLYSLGPIQSGCSTLLKPPRSGDMSGE